MSVFFVHRTLRTGMLITRPNSTITSTIPDEWSQEMENTNNNMLLQNSNGTQLYGVANISDQRYSITKKSLRPLNQADSIPLTIPSDMHTNKRKTDILKIKSLKRKTERLRDESSDEVLDLRLAMPAAQIDDNIPDIMLSHDLRYWEFCPDKNDRSTDGIIQVPLANKDVCVEQIADIHTHTSYQLEYYSLMGVFQIFYMISRHCFYALIETWTFLDLEEKKENAENDENNGSTYLWMTLIVINFIFIACCLWYAKRISFNNFFYQLTRFEKRHVNLFTFNAICCIVHIVVLVTFSWKEIKNWLWLSVWCSVAASFVSLATTFDVSGVELWTGYLRGGKTKHREISSLLRQPWPGFVEKVNTARPYRIFRNTRKKTTNWDRFWKGKHSQSGQNDLYDHDEEQIQDNNTIANNIMEEEKEDDTFVESPKIDDAGASQTNKDKNKISNTTLQ